MTDGKLTASFDMWPGMAQAKDEWIEAPDATRLRIDRYSEIQTNEGMPIADWQRIRFVELRDGDIFRSFHTDGSPNLVMNDNGIECCYFLAGTDPTKADTPPYRGYTLPILQAANLSEIIEYKSQHWKPGIYEATT